MGTDNPLGLTLAGVGVSTLGGLTVNGTALITEDLTAPNVYTKDETDVKLAERQVTITTPTVANSINLFASDRLLPIRGDEYDDLSNVGGSFYHNRWAVRL